MLIRDRDMSHRFVIMNMEQGMIDSLVELNTTTIANLELDIRLATANNFTGQPLYSRPAAFLHKDAYNALLVALKVADKLELTLKILDAFRPQEIQQKLWDHTPDPTYISNPQTGSRPHCRGIAIDLTLVDQRTGKELDMGTEFDDFRPIAHHNCTEVSQEVLQNRLTLAGLMCTAGFLHNPTEWWHYQLPEARNYPALTDAMAGSQMLA